MRNEAIKDRTEESAQPHRLRILIVGDAVVPTGYARVLRAIFGPLRTRYELHQLATRYDGSTHNWPWTLYRAADYGDPYGMERLPQLVDELKPDIIFILYDLSYQARYLARIQSARWKAAVVVYSPIESGPIEPEILAGLNGVSRYVVFTEYSRDVVLAACCSPHADPGRTGLPVPQVIPHGVDTIQFSPIGQGDGNGLAVPADARTSARTQLGMTEPEFENAFIVLNANRNLPKKRMDVTIEGFALFAKGKPANVKLFLHTQLQAQGWNVQLLARRYGVMDRLILSTANDDAPDVSSDRLNLIYNACDVGVNTSINEGWGLVSFEHGATRSAQVVAGNPCLKQLWGDSAVVLEPCMMLTNPGTHTTGYFVSPQSLCAALERLYADRTLCDNMAQRAFQNATQSKYAWPTICDQWDALLQEVHQLRFHALEQASRHREVLS